MKKVHLICNAHIDPVWLWQWEEGAAEAISTFRVAADFCEEYDGFVFNHNEAILYKWVEEYEPALFKRIQRLVKEGKWHIMGGWYLQPDCNMPNGESIIRQIITGTEYFKDKFNYTPTTAINFDSFGHSRGLVQILKKSGYDSYIICRPPQGAFEFKNSDFEWVGYDGSEIIVHRSDENYNSVRGKAAEELKQWLTNSDSEEVALFLWGVGNHGGGPSRIDLQNINQVINEEKDKIEIKHSVPEVYFNELKDLDIKFPKVNRSLNPVAEGCYTSQIRIKQKHRALENDIYMLEKMCSNAEIQGAMEYPQKAIREAIYDLMTAEFHDALPGSAIKTVEEDTIRVLDHGLEITSRLKNKAFFALSSGQPKVIDGQTPLLIYNPHPYAVKAIFESEFVLPSQNWNDEFTYPMLYQGEKQILCQPEQEISNFRIDWRKRAVFEVELLPSQMNRFDFKFEALPQKPKSKIQIEGGKITLKNEKLEVIINCCTGLMDSCKIDGEDYLKEGSFSPIVMNDVYNSWGVGFKNFDDIAGKFKLMSRERSAEFSGVDKNELAAVRIVEDGDVRTVVESLFEYNNSFLCLQYKIPKRGTEFEISIRVYWNEKDKMLKLAIPTTLKCSKYLGETMFGHEELNDEGKEAVSQKWSTVVSEVEDKAFSCINDGIYGSNFSNGEMRLTLLRSAAYSTSDFLGRKALDQDRFTYRMDQGEREFNFWFNGGKVRERSYCISKEAIVRNEKPYILSFCPSGEGEKLTELITISNNSIHMTALKKAENTNDYVLRIVETTGEKQITNISITPFNIDKEITLTPYEVKTLKLNIQSKTLEETSILE